MAEALEKSGAKLQPPWDRPMDVSELDRQEKFTRIEQDEAFVRAVLRAAELGLEHPPKLPAAKD